MARKLTTNSRLVNELFANYISTFVAFSELMNNSIQAKSKNIWIEIDYAADEELSTTYIKRISIKDDGKGVHINELETKLLDIGTTNKDGGKGIGRFASFQIGKEIEIETVGYCTKSKTFSKAIIPLSFDSFGNNINVSEINIPTDEEILKGKNHNTYYKVSITKLYPSYVTDKEPKKKIIDKFLRQNIADAIFERYPLKIFNKEIVFHINGQTINPTDFVTSEPIKIASTFTDSKGKEHKVLFDFMPIKKIEKIKVFLTVQNAGLNTIAGSLEYDATWLSPKVGGWFIYVSSSTLSSDIYRNIDLDDLDPDWRKVREFIKDKLNIFFKERNQEFDNFSDNLKKDAYYPYKEKTSSQSKVILFDKLAYLVEDRYHLLKDDNQLREIIYPLIDRTISNGELNKILYSILKLNNKLISKFSDLLEKTDLENIIEFSDKVATKIEEVDFLEKLVYSKWDNVQSKKDELSEEGNYEKKFELFQLKFDSLANLLCREFGNPIVENIENISDFGETYRDDLKFKRADVLNAYLFMFKRNINGYRQIRLVLYKD